MLKYVSLNLLEEGRWLNNILLFFLFASIFSVVPLILGGQFMHLSAAPDLVNNATWALGLLDDAILTGK